MRTLATLSVTAWLTTGSLASASMAFFFPFCGGFGGGCAPAPVYVARPWYGNYAFYYAPTTSACSPCCVQACSVGCGSSCGFNCGSGCSTGCGTGCSTCQPVSSSQPGTPSRDSNFNDSDGRRRDDDINTETDDYDSRARSNSSDEDSGLGGRSRWNPRDDSDDIGRPVRDPELDDESEAGDLFRRRLDDGNDSSSDNDTLGSPSDGFDSSDPFGDGIEDRRKPEVSEPESETDTDDETNDPDATEARKMRRALLTKQEARPSFGEVDRRLRLAGSQRRQPSERRWSGRQHRQEQKQRWIGIPAADGRTRL